MQHLGPVSRGADQPQDLWTQEILDTVGMIFAARRRIETALIQEQAKAKKKE